MHTSSRLRKASIGAVVGSIVLTMSACTGANSTASVEAAVDNFCQNEQQLTSGTAEYEKCVAERTDSVLQGAGIVGVF